MRGRTLTRTTTSRSLLRRRLSSRSLPSRSRKRRPKRGQVRDGTRSSQSMALRASILARPFYRVRFMLRQSDRRSTSTECLKTARLRMSTCRKPDGTHTRREGSLAKATEHNSLNMTCEHDPHAGHIRVFLGYPRATPRPGWRHCERASRASSREDADQVSLPRGIYWHWHLQQFHTS